LVQDVDVSWTRRLDWYRRLVTSGASYVTATDDHGRLIGYAMLAVEDGPDDTFDVEVGTAELITLVVARDRRSTGVGRKLLDAAEDIARDRGLETLKIAVMHGNTRALDFYEARGYSIAEDVLCRRLGEH
jgi:ribosomal protein S18 acetylase RimI-like enzyme